MESATCNLGERSIVPMKVVVVRIVIVSQAGQDWLDRRKTIPHRSTTLLRILIIRSLTSLEFKVVSTDFDSPLFPQPPSKW